MTERAKRLRKRILRMAHAGRDANLQSGFSSVEILRVLYDRVLRVSPETAGAPKRDRFVLSKGQATMALLALLAEKGYLPEKELETACRYDSRISMQADRTKLPFLENSAGSLGHGFPMAVGMAWANRILGHGGGVYVLAGDGEMNEGTMWEAALFASSEKLDNLTLIIDDNRSIGRMIDMGDLGEKLGAFGFRTVVADGHDEDALEQAVRTPHPGMPLAIVARTMRGYGSRTLMEDNAWFHRAPTDAELARLLDDVEHFEEAGRETV